MRMPSLRRSSRVHLVSGTRFGIPIALAVLAGCSGEVGGHPDTGTGTGTGTGVGGSATGGSAGAGTTTGTGAGGSAGVGMPTGGSGGAHATGGTGGAAPTGGTGGTTSPVANPLPASCVPTRVATGRAPIRRLTRFEYNNTIRDVLNDTTNPGLQLPSEVLASTSEIFGNNADSQPVSSSLADAYSNVASQIAARATATPAQLAKLDACASTITATTAVATQDTCARKLIEGFTSRAYRRAVTTTEVDELFALHKANATPAFANGVAAVLEGVLQSPDFLYRVEWGVKDAAQPGVARPTADEMATRLSYTLWGSAPDEALRTAAKAGQLATAEGVKAQATRMLADPKARNVVSFFFDKLLPIGSLTDLARDAKLYPTFTPTIGSLMRQETQRFMEYEVFENPAGTWKSVLTAPYTFVNADLARFYGIAGVTGTAFQKAPIDTTKRKGLLTQGGVMTGTITTNQSNPVLRGSFVVNKLLCRRIVLPADPAILALVKIPEVSGETSRQRFSAHSSNALCSGCHQSLDPLGFALENFDAVGLWRDTENGHAIDASGSMPDLGKFKNAVELVDALASSEETHACFASHWMDYAFGRSFDGSDDKSDDACITARINAAFKSSGYNVKQLLIDLTQSDAFLYMPAVKE